MNQIIFEGVRCFHTRHICPLRPITLLLGENSSGKTTFLALTRIAWDVAQGELSEDVFNEEPFLLGAYDQIASYRGGKAGRAKSFAIGMQTSLQLDPRQKASQLFTEEVKITARFVSQGSQSKLKEWVFESGAFKLVARQSTKQTRFDITITTPKGFQVINERVLFRGSLSIRRMLNELRFWLSQGTRDSNKDLEKTSLILSEAEFRTLQQITFEISNTLGPRPYAFAPIRTKPQRTYDPLKEVPRPEGSHVPMVLARTLLDETEEKRPLQEALSKYGTASGLFNNVEAKRKGHKESDPFQISVKTVGPAHNLVDVGYGISQVLPILVDVVEHPKGSRFLLQQPEVHLHPKAQAELGSFLATLAKEQNKHFVIETHSDYLIDRIRMDIRDKKYLRPDDVAILYFERSPGGVEIHQLELDEYGNVSNAPPTYRTFFLEEERRLLGV